MDSSIVASRAAELGAAIRCVTHITPSSENSHNDSGTVGECEVLVERDGDGVSLMRNRFRAEGFSPKRAKVAGTKAGLVRLDSFLTTIADMQARERAITGHGFEGVVYPPWAFSADGLAMEIAAANGIDLTNCSKPAKHVRTFTLCHGRLATPQQAWDWSRTMHAVDSYNDQSGPGGMRAFEAEMKGSHLAMRVMGVGDRQMTLREEPGGTWLLLWGTALPDTVLLGLRGRRLSSVVEGLGDDHEILKAESRDGVPWLKIRGPMVPLAPAPDGVDTSWLKL